MASLKHGISSHPPGPGDAVYPDSPLDAVEQPVSDASQHQRSLLTERKLTVPKAAKLLGVGESKMRQIIAAGGIPVLDLDGKHMLLEADLEAYLRGHYGAMTKSVEAKPGLPPLPRHIAESELLKKAG